MNTLSEIDKAYLAGFIDGEGCIFISEYTCDRTPNPIMSLLVVLSQSDYSFLKAIQEKIGIGKVTGGYKAGNDSLVTKYRDNCRKVYQLRITSDEAYQFLLEIQDYLIIKKKQAEIAILFQKTMNCVPGGRVPGSKNAYRLPKDILDKRRYYRNRLKQLKRQAMEDIVKEPEYDNPQYQLF